MKKDRGITVSGSQGIYVVENMIENDAYMKDRKFKKLEKEDEYDDYFEHSLFI
jgi:hypothetical protein